MLYRNAYFLTPGPDPTSVATQMAKSCLNLDPCRTPLKPKEGTFLKDPTTMLVAQYHAGAKVDYSAVSGFQTPNQAVCQVPSTKGKPVCTHSV